MSSGVSRFISVSLLIVGAIGMITLIQQGSSRDVASNEPEIEKPKQPEITSEPVEIKPAVGTVMIGGIQRKETDVQLSERPEVGTYKKLIKRQGYSPALDPNTNPQVKAVADALAKDENPERFSSFVVKRNFDQQAFNEDPKSYSEEYASIVEPGRVFATAQPGEGVTPIRAEGKRFHRLKQGEAVRLTVEAEPFAPVSFNSNRLGQFENQLTSTTVVAGEDGIATATYTASGGTIDQVQILAGSPVNSGQVKFSLYVSVDR